MHNDSVILRPLLFIIYMNDTTLQISESELGMYADDSTVGATAKTRDIVEEKLNTYMENINDWCNANKMAINTDKTKAMLVTMCQCAGALRTLFSFSTTIYPFNGITYYIK